MNPTTLNHRLTKDAALVVARKIEEEYSIEKKHGLFFPDTQRLVKLILQGSVVVTDIKPLPDDKSLIVGKSPCYPQQKSFEVYLQNSLLIDLPSNP